MQTKLTLRMDDKLIHSAKTWASAHHISLSQVVAQYFETLQKSQEKNKLDKWTKKMSGIIPTETEISDQELRQAYRDHLNNKHG